MENGSLAAANDRAVHVWDAATLQSKSIYPGHDGMIRTITFSPDGNNVASAGDDGAIKIWKLDP